MNKELKQLIQTGEGYHLEFKESLDKSLIEEVCAFAPVSLENRLLMEVIF